MKPDFVVSYLFSPCGIMNVPKEKPFSAILYQTTLTVMTNTPPPVLIACVPFRTQAVMFINCRWSLSSAQVTKAPSRLKVNLMHPPPRYLSDAVDHEFKKKQKTVVI